MDDAAQNWHAAKCEFSLLVKSCFNFAIARFANGEGSPRLAPNPGQMIQAPAAVAFEELWTESLHHRGDKCGVICHGQLSAKAFFADFFHQLDVSIRMG